MDSLNATPFTAVYDRFLSKVTDNLYLELTKEDTYALLQDLLISAIPMFRFPRKDLNNYELGVLHKETIPNKYLEDGSPEMTAEWKGGHFLCELSGEEQEILALNMVVLWVTQQIATVELTRQKFSGSDFKFSSQAQHMNKLITVKEDFAWQTKVAQNLYSRRKVDNKTGLYQSTIGDIMKTPSYGYKIGE